MKSKRPETAKEYGERREYEITADLNEANPFEDAPYTQYRDKFYHYDVFGANNVYEIKSLRYGFDTYDTAVMNVSKVLKKRPEESLIFIFSYKEKSGKEELYYCHYNEAVFNGYGQRHLYLKTGETPLVCDIPLEHLIKLEIYEWVE